MITASAHSRRFMALAVLGAGLALALLGVLAVWNDAQRARVPEVSGPVFANWSDLAGSAARIEILTADDQFAVERRADGWVMPSRGDYPVSSQIITNLDTLLADMRFERAMTRDGEKFDRLSLSDPFSGGSGTLISILDDQDNTLASFTLGRQQNDGDGLYLRLPDEARAFAVTGSAPELTDLSRWLGLDFWSLDASAVARAEITPEDSQSWFVQRAGMSQRSYELIRPIRWRLITAGAANGVATAGAQIRFRDVRPRDSLDGAVIASHDAVTFSGLAYRFDFVGDGDQRWALITARALSDDAEPRAARLNQITQGWAYLVSDDAYERLTRTLNQVAEPSR